jgi:hypothetical protein
MYRYRLLIIHVHALLERLPRSSAAAVQVPQQASVFLKGRQRAPAGVVPRVDVLAVFAL